MKQAGPEGIAVSATKFSYLELEMPRPDFRKIVFLPFAMFAVMVASMGMAAFALMLWDFQFA